MQKATLNYIIPSVQLNFKGNQLVSNMITPSMDAVIMLTMKNDIVELPADDDISFNFTDPNINVKPYVDLIDEETAKLVVDDNKMKVSTKDQRFTFHFSSPDFVGSYKGDAPKIDAFFFDEVISDDLMKMFDKIKKIAGKFGKIYFTIENKTLYIEATDKTNTFANSMKTELISIDHKDISLCYDFKNINALLTLLAKSYENFRMKLHVTDDEEGGILLFEKEDESEKFYLLSHSE